MDLYTHSDKFNEYKAKVLRFTVLKNTINFKMNNSRVFQVQKSLEKTIYFLNFPQFAQENVFKEIFIQI